MTSGARARFTRA